MTTHTNNGKAPSFRKSKGKSGCITCRIRKIKCDESKPSCRKCLSTGRKCDGYETPFVNYIKHNEGDENHGTQLSAKCKAVRTDFNNVTPQDIGSLNHSLSTKTSFGAQFSCHEDARRILEASSNDAAIRYAVLSLSALRRDFDTPEKSASSTTREMSDYDSGIQQYNNALRALATDLSTEKAGVIQSALLCCQLFISIEQVRRNYDAMAQHIVRGLSIMREYRARPVLVGGDSLMPAHSSELPLLDVFIIKLFAAPCRLAQPPTSRDRIRPDSSRSPSLAERPEDGSRRLHTLAQDTRQELKGIALQIMDFLPLVSTVKSTEDVAPLMAKKAALLGLLESWLIVLDNDQMDRPSESTATSLMRLFHRILKVILLGVLDAGPELDAQLQAENAQLSGLADCAAEKALLLACLEY